MSKPGTVGGKEEAMSEFQTIVSELRSDILKLREEVESAFQGLSARQTATEKNITSLYEAVTHVQNSVNVLQKTKDLNIPIPMDMQIPPTHTGGKPPTAALTPLPKKYAGDPKDFDNFLVQCDLHFQVRPLVFATDEQKIHFMLMLLEGRALQWAAPLIKRKDAVLKDYDAFLRLMTNVFENKYHAQTRKQEFLTIQQGKHDLVSYIAYFQSLAAEVNWSEDTQVSLFHKGLRDDLKDAIAGVHPLPDTLHEFFDLCLRVTHRMKERRGNNRSTLTVPSLYSSSNNRGEPMVLGEITDTLPIQTTQPEVIGELRGPLSEDERKRRRELRLCFYCGKAGHSINSCPVKTTSGNGRTLQEGRP